MSICFMICWIEKIMTLLIIGIAACMFIYLLVLPAERRKNNNSICNQQMLFSSLIAVISCKNLRILAVTSVVM